MLLTIIVLLIFTSYLCIRAADEFIKDTSGDSLSLNDFIVGMLIYIVPTAFYTLVALSHSVLNLKSLPVYFMFGFLSQFYVLDKMKHWLPFCFTTSFIISGILSTGLSHGINLSITKVFIVLMAYSFFLLFRKMANFFSEKESLGLGDVYLIVGLLTWLDFNEVLYVLLLAFAFILIRVLVSKFTSCQLRGVPLAPYVCFSITTLFIGAPINSLVNLYR